MDTNEIAEQVRMCAACPKMCRHVCPTFFAWRSESPTPHGRALLIHQDIVGTRALDDRGVEILYQCLECSHCLTWCVPEIDIASIVEHKRIELVNEGRYPEGLDRMKDSIKSNHNPFDESHSRRRSAVATKAGEGRKLIYFIGCTSSYREQEIAQETIDLLHSIGSSVTLLDDEWCCGSPLFRTGFVNEALEQAKHNVEVINSMEGDEVVVTCPGCYRVLTQDYPVRGLELNKPVKHISQLLAEQLDKIPASKIEGDVTYHDACHLGRHCGIYDEPRQVIQHVSGGSFIEMERTKDNAGCCGNGAGMRTLFTEQARAIGKDRIDQAQRTKTKYLITACPFCKNMLEAEADGAIEVIDLPEFVRMAQRNE